MSINRYRLRTLARQGHRGAILAENGCSQRPDRLIGLILLGNNLANNLAATARGGRWCSKPGARNGWPSARVSSRS